jgi:hypothetical protein
MNGSVKAIRRSPDGQKSLQEFEPADSSQESPDDERLATYESSLPEKVRRKCQPLYGFARVLEG